MMARKRSLGLARDDKKGNRDDNAQGDFSTTVEMTRRPNTPYPRCAYLLLASMLASRQSSNSFGFALPAHIFKPLHHAIEAIADSVEIGSDGLQVLIDAEGIVAPLAGVGQEYTS